MIWIYMAGLAIILVLNGIASFRYETKGRGIRNWFLPLGELAFEVGRCSARERWIQYQQLYLLSEEEAKERVHMHSVATISLAVLIFCIGLVLCGAMELSQLDSKVGGSLNVTREEWGGEDGIYDFYFNKGEKENQIHVNVAPREYTEKEIRQLFSQAKKEVRKSLVGENESLDAIEGNVVFLDSIPNSPVNVEYGVDENPYLTSLGKISKMPPKEGYLVGLTIYYTFEKKEEMEQFTIKLVPPTKTQEQKESGDVKSYIQQLLKAHPQQKEISIPRVIQGKVLYTKEEKPVFSGNLIVFTIILCVIVLIRHKEEEKKLQQQRRDNLKRNYPVFIQQFTLYLQGGLTVRSAFGQMTKDSHVLKADKGRNYLLEELTITVNELHAGASETKAYYDLGKRLESAQYVRFITYLIQNLSKGNHGIVETLEREVKLAFFQRKEYARKKGEEAGTKLLLPMMLLLIVILLLVLIPAFSNFAL